MAAIKIASTDKRSDNIGLLMALSGAFLFSTKPIIIKWLYSLGMATVPLLWLRMAISVPIYLIIGCLAWQRLATKPTLLQVLEAMGVGIVGYYCASFFDLWGLEYIGAQLERLILYAYPSFVVVLGFLFFRQTLTRFHGVALLLTYLGLVVVYSHDLQLPDIDASQLQTGTLLVLTSALFFACYILFSRRVIQVMGSLLFTSIAMAAAAVATLVHFSLDQQAQLPPMSNTIWLGVLALAVLATVLPSFLVSEAIKRIGPARASVTGSVGPIMTTLLAVILLNEPFGIASALGIGLVISGVYILQRAHR